MESHIKIVGILHIVLSCMGMLAAVVVLLVPTVWVLKGRLSGTLTTVPTPVRITIWGLPPALLLMVMDDLRGPAAVGVNAGLSVQLSPAARVPGQL